MLLALAFGAIRQLVQSLVDEVKAFVLHDLRGDAVGRGSLFIELFYRRLLIRLRHVLNDLVDNVERVLWLERLSTFSPFSLNFGLFDPTEVLLGKHFLVSGVEL